MLTTGQKCVVGAEALLEAGATRVGAELDALKLERFLHASAVTALVDRALASMAQARRTRRELELRLRRVQPDARLVAEALDRLEASGALCDEEVANTEAASQLRRGRAPARIRQNLRRKGIDARGADRAIAAAVEQDGFDELTVCREQAAKRWRSLASLDRAVARRRLSGFLQRRGFSGHIVRVVLAELERGA